MVVFQHHHLVGHGARRLLNILPMKFSVSIGDDECPPKIMRRVTKLFQDFIHLLVQGVRVHGDNLLN
ncbi:MAG: hypothetical protein JNL11_05185 [Bdellovibrionaceae bacterium]|nr:hypothetical protein [Pseudobdellovibrionaceae bacterium]